MVYDNLSRAGPFRLVNCWAHVKRKADDIEENFPLACGELRITDIEVNGRVVPVVSSSYAVAGASETKDTTKKIAGGAALGAAIGAIADGGSGAAWGAAIGAGAGTAASAATAAKPAVVAAQSVVKFRLEQALSVPIAVRVTETTADDGA